MVDRGDPRYPVLLDRGINARFRADPERFHVIRTREQAVAAVQRCVDSGARLAVRSGGHCFESLVDDPGVDALLDVSTLDGVAFDHEFDAYSVGSGTTLGAMYRTLFLGWGRTVPAGRCPGIGVGGHVPGGGGGALSRRQGLSVDHLYGVEVVVVDASGQARTLIATREKDDPHRDLWWAHTGGGGGSFGLVTRYLFRSDDTFGEDHPLPVPPTTVRRTTVRWEWSEVDERSFRALVRNFGAWHERHGRPDDPGTHLDNSLVLPRVGGGPITLEAAVDADYPEAEGLTAEFLAEVCRGTNLTPRAESTTSPWLTAVLASDEFDGVRGRFKSKAAFLRSGWSDEQVDLVYRRLTNDTFYQNPAAAVYLLSHGGAVNGIGGADTAMAHRDAVLKAYWSVFWMDGREDPYHLEWVRSFYRGVFADAGGVPDPARGYAGAFVNYADADLVDTALNTSGAPWHHLYFRDNYAALQRVKTRWDPRDVFRHTLSARLPR